MSLTVVYIRVPRFNEIPVNLSKYTLREGYESRESAKIYIIARPGTYVYKKGFFMGGISQQDWIPNL